MKSTELLCGQVLAINKKRGFRLYIKVDLERVILKNFKISALTLRFALRDCGNRAHLPFGKCVLFEISCADIAQQVGFFYKLKRQLAEKTCWS